MVRSQRELVSLIPSMNLQSHGNYLQGGDIGLEGNIILAKPDMFGSSWTDRVALLSSLLKVGPPEPSL